MSEYEKRIREIHIELGISSDYERQLGIPLQVEDVDLVGIGKDIFGRPQKLSKAASNFWGDMKEQAAKEGVLLEVVSAYRSVEKQTKIIQKKLQQGQSISKILEVIAAPGYSEHHTGRALDITEPGYEPLTESFELATAFAWLSDNAKTYSFELSYPKGNSSGVSYEPWHWAYHK